MNQNRLFFQRALIVAIAAVWFIRDLMWASLPAYYPYNWISVLISIVVVSAIVFFGGIKIRSLLILIAIGLIFDPAVFVGIFKSNDGRGVGNFLNWGVSVVDVSIVSLIIFIIYNSKIHLVIKSIIISLFSLCLLWMIWLPYYRF